MLGDKGYIIGKEIEKESLGVQRAANGFPLHRRSRASPHLDPKAVLSSTGMCQRQQTTLNRSALARAVSCTSNNSTGHS